MFCCKDVMGSSLAATCSIETFPVDTISTLQAIRNLCCCCRLNSIIFVFTIFGGSNLCAFAGDAFSLSLTSFEKISSHSIAHH